MSSKFIQMLSKHAENGGIIVWDVDGVLAPYEFGIHEHCIEDWETLFSGDKKSPYEKISPVPCLYNFIHKTGVAKSYVCSVAEPYEEKSKREYARKNYGIPEDHIVMVRTKDEKLKALKRIQNEKGGVPIAIVDDSVPVLDKIHKDGSGFIIVHISSFLS